MHVPRFRPTCLLLFLLYVTTAHGQTVEELELLPPLGDTASESPLTPEAILEPVEGIEGGMAVEPPWWQPRAWFSSPVWDFGAEAGINGSEGNAQALSILAAINGKRATEGNELEWDLKYGKSQTGGIETQHYALFNSRWDWKFSPVWFLYNKNVVEYDEFKAFDLRLVLSGGLGHHLIKNETTTLTSRIGAGASREFGGPEREWTPEANFGGDFEHQLSRRQKLKLTTDYYPSWEDAFHDYRLVTNAYWEILLDQETNLSLKLGAVDRYDSTPNGALANDIDYFVTLLWKL
jgi:putative salt-induced outer membrane protein YdiY